jgi:hypothetical protein
MSPWRGAFSFIRKIISRFPVVSFLFFFWGVFYIRSAALICDMADFISTTNLSSLFKMMHQIYENQTQTMTEKWEGER